MNRWIGTLALACLALPTFAQESPVFVPRCSQPNFGWATTFAHTNFLILDGAPQGVGNPFGGPAVKAGGPSGYSPSMIRSAYKLPADGGSGAIAVVLAYHYPTSLNDFNAFSKQFGLPTEASANAAAPGNKVFQAVYATGAAPAVDTGWAQEAALDIEWSHALAPRAKIYLVEAKSASIVDLGNAVAKAASLPGVTQISMSWGSSEFSTETFFNSYFPAKAGLQMFAASGDRGGVPNFPSTSPNVFAVGGTSLRLDSFGNAVSETGWSGAGGGVSPYEARPAYQAKVNSGRTRSVPDLALVADPYTGVAVFDSTPASGRSGWMVFGGTSVACPCVAGIANLLNWSPAGFGDRLYGGALPLRDVVSGAAGGNAAKRGYDLVTGMGAPLGK